MAVNRVTIRGVTGFTPISGDWVQTPAGDSDIFTATGPATARIHLATGDFVEVEIADGVTGTITITGTDAVVRYP